MPNFREKVLIFGAGGQDGRHLSHIFRSNEFFVVGVSSNPLLDSCDNNILVDYNIPIDQRIAQIACLFEEHLFTYIVDFSAYNQPTLSSGWNDDTRVLESNLYFPHCLLNLISQKQKQASSFFCGSAHQYKQPLSDVVLVDENTAPSPRNQYGLCKQHLRSSCDFYRKRFNLSINFGILFNHDSSYRGKNFLLPRLIAAMYLSFSTSEICHLDHFLADFSKNFQFDLSDARDIATDIFQILINGNSSDFILSSNKLISFSDLCTAVALEFSSIFDCPWEHKQLIDDLIVEHFSSDLFDRNMPALQGDNSKISLIYNRSPRSYQEMLHDMVTSFCSSR